MKQHVLMAACVVAAVTTTTNLQAQSWKDLFNKENIEKVVEGVTGKSAALEMAGTWSYQGAAIELKSDDVLSNLGGGVASAAAAGKLNEQLAKVGIHPGGFSVVFSADSTFNAGAGDKGIRGTYSYHAADKKVDLKVANVIALSAKVNYTSSTMDLLFDADKLLALITTLSGQSSNSTLQTVNALAKNYKGMLLGFSLAKQ
ncbi:MAG: DUF4923 family protein [Mediterranea sp.]|jgi:hypothetical protein|nr:DUF4923 family protein [Mediterranea sp.]